MRLCGVRCVLCAVRCSSCRGSTPARDASQVLNRVLDRAPQRRRYDGHAGGVTGGNPCGASATNAEVMHPCKRHAADIQTGMGVARLPLTGSVAAPRSDAPCSFAEHVDSAEPHQSRQPSRFRASRKAGCCMRERSAPSMRQSSPDARPSSVRPERCSNTTSTARDSRDPAKAAET